MALVGKGLAGAPSIGTHLDALTSELARIADALEATNLTSGQGLATDPNARRRTCGP